MSDKNDDTDAGHDAVTSAVRKERRRRDEWVREGEPTMLQYVGQIGILGWMIVAPTLIGLFVGRWLDVRFGSGIFWSAPLMLIGLLLGCWSGWRWMHK